MVDLLSFLSDSDFYKDEKTGELVITSPIIQTDGDFQIESSINISSNCNSVIKCKKLTILSQIITLSSLTFETSLSLKDTQNLTMKNCTIINTSTETEPLIRLVTCENCLLSHVTFKDSNEKCGLFISNSIVTADNLYFCNLTRPNIVCANSSFLTLSDSKFQHSNSNGINVSDQSSIEISNCLFSELQYPSIFTEGSSITIKSCTFENLDEKAIFLSESNGFEIENSHFIKIKKHGVQISDGSQGTLKGNEFKDIESNCIYISNNCDILISENSIQNSMYPAIYVSKKSVVSIQNNKLSKSDGCAIALRGAHHVEINDNKIDDINGTGISVSNTNSCLIQNCEITNCSFASVESYNESNVTVKNNKIKNIDKYAFYCFTDGKMNAEKNEIEKVNESMVNLIEKGGGYFVDNKILNCPKQCEYQTSSLFFFSGNGDFTPTTNDKSKICDSIVFQEIKKIDNSTCIICHKNKRECYFNLCCHKVCCNECSEKLINDQKNCPLCRFPIEKALHGINAVDENICIICYDKKVDCIVAPCGHVVACSECLENWFKSKSECPLCRKENSFYKKIYDYS